MECFQLVESVLDEIYPLIPGQTEDEKDDRIRESMDHLSDQYKRRLLKGVSIDYTDPAVRFAYIYTYVTAHACMAYRLLDMSSDLDSLFNAPKVTAACIGGGPGSELLGILKFMRMRQKTALSPM